MPQKNNRKISKEEVKGDPPTVEMPPKNNGKMSKE
jgi:hypothetical protein